MSSSQGGYPRLVGDIGGTHARFATVAGPGAALSDPSSHACDDFDGIESLLRHRLANSIGPAPAACALGIATPLLGDEVRMTNRAWSFSIEALKAQMGFARLAVLNDFATLALALPTLAPETLVAIGGGRALPLAGKVAVGPGTGLGVSGLVWAAGRWRPVAGEGGHVSLAAQSALEDDVLRVLRDRFGHVSAERVLSGPGLVELHRALCEIGGVAAPALDAADITGRALDQSDAACVESVRCFLGWLGAFASDVALSFGALGGVYVGGGIVPKLQPILDASAFRERFEDKGRYRAYLAAIPVWLLADASEAALRGADLALDLDA